MDKIVEILSISLQLFLCALYYKCIVYVNSILMNPNFLTKDNISCTLILI